MPAQRGASWLKGRCQWHRGNRHPAADRGNPRGGSSPVRLTGVNGFKRKALCAFNQGGTADHSVPSLSKGRFFYCAEPAQALRSISAPTSRRNARTAPAVVVLSLGAGAPAGKVGQPNAGYPLHVFRAMPDCETALDILSLGGGAPAGKPPQAMRSISAPTSHSIARTAPALDIFSKESPLQNLFQQTKNAGYR